MLDCFPGSCGPRKKDFKLVDIQNYSNDFRLVFLLSEKAKAYVRTRKVS